jgi:hypothetical protein
MCQALVIVVAAQGVSDNVILPHLAAVFRHSRYRNFSIEEWASVSIPELASIFKRCSCHNKSAFFMHFFLVEILHHGPQTNLCDLMSCRGFQKKSACLWLMSVYNINFGRPTGSHVLDAYVRLCWMPPDSSEELASYMLEMYLPREMWELPNIYLAGIQQNLSIGPEETFVVLSCACLLGGQQTLSLVESILPKDFRHPHLPRERQEALLEMSREVVKQFLELGSSSTKFITNHITPPILASYWTGGNLTQQRLCWSRPPEVGNKGLLPALLVDRKRNAKKAAKRKLFADEGKGGKQTNLTGGIFGATQSSKSSGPQH